jgi:hypothetical protein
MEESDGLVGRIRWMAEAARLFKPIFRKTLREEWEVSQDAEVISEAGRFLDKELTENSSATT